MKLFFVFGLLFSSIVLASDEQFLLDQLKKSIINDYHLATSKTVVEEKVVTPSKGEQAVEAMLQKNREKLKERQEKILQANRQRLADKKNNTSSSSSSLMDQAKNWQQSKIDEVNTWTQDQLAMLDRWEKDKLALVKRLPGYKKNTYHVEESMAAEAKSVKQLPKIDRVLKEVPISVFAESFMINDAFPFPVKDQGQRPTCASFAGIRALEIVLAQKGVPTRLSEQYFYYLSLPKCQQSPCDKQGSWVLGAYQMTKDASKPLIPLERDCPYSPSPLQGNTTQIPMPASCQKGVSRADEFYRVSSFAQILDSLKRQMPVVGAFRLSESFYQNNGHVFLHNPSGPKGKLDEHAAGHALLIVGAMKLPESLSKTEGEYCLVIANSWGEGWGKGGHSCLSQAWIEKFRYPSDFVAVKSASYQ